MGHGETYMHPADVLWWAKGGEFHGSSPERIAFLRRILEETPGGFLEPLPSAWDVPTAGIRHEYEISYFGFNQPTYRNFVMPAGRRYEVDIIDTWNMSIDTLPDAVEGRFRVELPAASSSPSGSAPSANPPTPAACSPGARPPWRSASRYRTRG
ncbi:conserved hypothetical protein [Arthrobacter sp. Hiyo8]|nr:conserved hypothetical protein [Arthrobacter sp. Hiyo8]